MSAAAVAEVYAHLQQKAVPERLLSASPAASPLAFDLDYFNARCRAFDTAEEQELRARGMELSNEAIDMKMEKALAQLREMDTDDTPEPVRSAAQDAIDSIESRRKERSHETSFLCSGDWHLVRLGKYAVPIHNLILRVQTEGRDFYGSVKHIAEYFGADDRPIRAQIHAMKDMGFLEEILTRTGNSTIYRALTHKEWTAKYGDGGCCSKREKEGNPSQKMGVPTDAPLPEYGSTPSQKMHQPLPKNGIQVSDAGSERVTDPTSEPGGGKDTSPKPAARANPDNGQDLSAKKEAEEFFVKCSVEMGSCDARNRREIEQAAATKGPLVWKALLEAQGHFANRSKGLVGLRDIWGTFVREELPRIDSILKDDDFRSHHDPVYQAAVELHIAYQRWQHCKSYNRIGQDKRYKVPADLAALWRKEKFDSMEDASAAFARLHEVQKKYDEWVKANPEPDDEWY